VTSGFGFLGGAQGRLLPASLPFRFFAAAAVFHVLLWLVLLLVSDHLTSFRGGLAPALAGVHLLVLGVLTTTAIGAAAQLLPVATRRALVAQWPIRLVFWTFVPGLTLLIAGMYFVRIPLIVGGAAASAFGLVLFAMLLGDNLRRAGGLPVVAAYGWTALLALLGVAALGVALSLDFLRGFLPDPFAVARAHMILGAYGFMGMLALGFSHILIPMFALSSAPRRRPATLGFAVAAAGIAVGVLGALLDRPGLLTAAAVLGLAAAGIHIAIMQRALKTGMRKRQGLSFVLVRAAWASLLLSLIVGLAAVNDRAGPNGPALFGLILLGGWLLTFLLGVLQRILPFLASMHAAGPSSASPPRLSELGGTMPLKVHAVCHGLALVGLTSAILITSPAIARAASGIGLAGAIAFAVFTGGVLRRVVSTPRGSKTGTGPNAPA